MDENNNTPNPYDEEHGPDENRSAAEGQNTQNTYNMPYQDPYNMPPQQNNGQYNPYAQQPQQGQQYNPYQQNNGQYNPYQQQSQQYNMPPQGSPYQYPQGYVYPQGQQMYGMPYQQAPSAGMAVASLVLGIISLLLGICMFALPFLLIIPILGVTLGVVFKSRRLPVGKGLSTAGIVTSVLSVVLSLLLMIAVAAFVFSDAGTEYMRSNIEVIKNSLPEYYEWLYRNFAEEFPQWFSEALIMFFGK